jgi:hypothetical protein
MKSIELVHRLHEIWNTGNLELIDSICAADFLAHYPASSEIPARRDIDGIRFGVTRIRTAFPDWHERVLDVLAHATKLPAATSQQERIEAPTGASSPLGGGLRLKRSRCSELPRIA